MAQEPTFWTQRDAAREYTRLANVCGSLFAALGALAPSLEPPASALAAAQLARRLGRHAAAWGELVPESILLEDARASAPPRSVVEPAASAVVPALEALRADLATLLTRSSEIGDAAARREAAATLADLDEALDPLRQAEPSAAT